MCFRLLEGRKGREGGRGGEGRGTEIGERLQILKRNGDTNVTPTLHQRYTNVIPTLHHYFILFIPEHVSPSTPEW